MTILAFGFADGNTANGGTGHIIDLGSGPSANQADVLCVVSDAAVDTPAGFLRAPDHLGNMAAVVFRRLGSGGSTVTIHTSADAPTLVLVVRLDNVSAVDDAAQTVASGADTSSPAHSTGTLAATGEAVVAFLALHNLPGSAPTAANWSGGFSGLDSMASQGSGASGVAGALAVHLNAGTAPVSPSATWTNAASDRGMLTLSWVALGGGITVVQLGAVHAAAAGRAAATGVGAATKLAAGTSIGSAATTGRAATAKAGTTEAAGPAGVRGAASAAKVVTGEGRLVTAARGLAGTTKRSSTQAAASVAGYGVNRIQVISIPGRGPASLRRVAAVTLIDQAGVMLR